MSIFSNNLKALRAQKEMSQQELANSMGISKSALNMYERGERQPNFETLEIIADYFNVSLDFLLGKTSDIKCPICYQNYDPLNIIQTKQHDEFHNKFLKAQAKYGEILLYGDALEKRSECISEFRNPSLSLEERIAAYDDYLKYSFIVDIWNCNLSLDHENFDEFAKKEAGTLQPDYLISEELCKIIRKKNGAAPNSNVIIFSTKEESVISDNDETALIFNFRKLNPKGQSKLIETSNEMLCSPLYNDNYQEALNAAHENNEGATEAQKNAADKIMMDDSEWE